MNARAQLLVRYLSEEHGLNITEATAREDISSQVDFTAERMRVGRQAAKYYVTEDVVRGLGDHIAQAVRSAQAQDPRRGLRAIPDDE